MYLFKNVANKWIFGNTIYDECPSGQYRVMYSADLTKVSIRYMSDGTFIETDRDISYFENSSGESYADYNTFKTATDGFFLGSAGGTLTDASGNVLLPNGTPVRKEVEITRPSDVIAYTAGDSINASTTSPVAFELASMSTAAGGGGFITKLKVETNITAMANATLRIYFFRDTPTSITADNVAMTIAYANSSKRSFYIDITLDPLVTGSDTIFGQTLDLSTEYACLATSMYFTVQTNSAFTPTSGGKIKVIVSALKVN